MDHLPRQNEEYKLTYNRENPGEIPPILPHQLYPAERIVGWRKRNRATIESQNYMKRGRRKDNRARVISPNYIERDHIGRHNFEWPIKRVPKRVPKRHWQLGMSRAEREIFRGFLAREEISIIRIAIYAGLCCLSVLVSAITASHLLTVLILHTFLLLAYHLLNRRQNVPVSAFRASNHTLSRALILHTFLPLAYYLLSQRQNVPVSAFRASNHTLWTVLILHIFLLLVSQLLSRQENVPVCAFRASNHTFSIVLVLHAFLLAYQLLSRQETFLASAIAASDHALSAFDIRYLNKYVHSRLTEVALVMALIYFSLFPPLLFLVAAVQILQAAWQHV
jgi:hypothetical protein